MATKKKYKIMTMEREYYNREYLVEAENEEVAKDLVINGSIDKTTSSKMLNFDVKIEISEEVK